MNLLAAATTESPRYTHDCAKCVFLGQAHDDEGSHDLYLCEQGGIEKTVIARFGDDGPEYRSGMAFSFGASALLTLARELAEARGLVSFDACDAMHYVKDGTPAEEQLLAQLPFTPEYQAILALEQDDLERGRGLVAHLHQHALKRAARRSGTSQDEANANAAHRSVERAAQVLSRLRKLPERVARSTVVTLFSSVAAPEVQAHYAA